MLIYILWNLIWLFKWVAIPYFLFTRIILGRISQQFYTRQSKIKFPDGSYPIIGHAI